MKEYVRTILDYPVKGIQFRDITTLLKNSKHFSKQTYHAIIYQGFKIKNKFDHQNTHDI